MDRQSPSSCSAWRPTPEEVATIVEQMRPILAEMAQASAAELASWSEHAARPAGPRSTS